MSETSLHEAALRYAAHGWPVFPLAPREKTPATKHGLKDASTDPAAIDAWWTANPDYNIGLNCGGAGLVVVDVDGAEGSAAWSELCDVTGGCPGTMTVSTGREDGGRHLYFVAPAGSDIRNSASKIASHVDIRANGGYVVLPPSIHPTGKKYAFVGDVREPVALPDWIAEALAKPKARSSNSPAASPDSPARAAHPPIPEGGTAQERYVRSAIESEIDLMAKAQKGALNDALNRHAFAIGALWAACPSAGSQDEVIERLYQAGVLAGCDNPGKDRGTIERSFAAGTESPRDLSAVHGPTGRRSTTTRPASPSSVRQAPESAGGDELPGIPASAIEEVRNCARGFVHYPQAWVQAMAYGWPDDREDEFAEMYSALTDRVIADAGLDRWPSKAKTKRPDECRIDFVAMGGGSWCCLRTLDPAPRVGDLIKGLPATYRLDPEVINPDTDRVIKAAAQRIDADALAVMSNGLGEGYRSVRTVVGVLFSGWLE